MLEHYDSLTVPHEIKARDNNGRSILHWASYLGQCNILEWVFGNYGSHIDIGHVDSQGYTPLDLASLKGYSECVHWKNQAKCVQLIIQQRPPMQKNKTNPMQWALYYGNKELVQYLAEMDFSLLIRKNEENLFPIDYLFMDYKNEIYKSHTQEIFDLLVNKYIKTQYNVSLASSIARLKSLKPMRSTNSHFQSNLPASSAVYDKQWLPDPEPQSAYNSEKYQIYQKRNNFSVASNGGQGFVIEAQEEPEMEVINFKEDKKQVSMSRPRRRFKVSHVQRKEMRQLFQNRLLFWSAYANRMTFTTFFLGRGNNPFIIEHMGMSALHAAARNGSEDVLRLILESDFTFEDDKVIFDKKEMLKVTTSHMASTALHMAIENENYNCAHLLVEYGACTEQVNYRNLKPFELTYNQKILEYYEKNIKVHDEYNFAQEHYCYVLQTKGHKKFQDDIVFLQLTNLVESFQKEELKFEFLIMKGPDLDKGGSVPAYFYYILRMPPETIYKLAEKHGILSYHFRKKIICPFSYQEHTYFEYPKDIQQHQLVIDTLNLEFDVDKFLLEGLLVAHYPLMNKEKLTSLKHLHYSKVLSHLTTVADYFGPQIGFYFAFMLELSIWLVLPALAGLALGLYMILMQATNSSITPLYALLMALWSSLFIESWKRRENELAFLWDMHKYKNNEPVRVMYNGQFALSGITGKVIVYDSFTTFKRRLVADVPIISLGLVIIVGLFYTFLMLMELDVVRENSLYQVLVGSLNGACMNVVSAIYKFICFNLVNWENHKFDTEMQQSYILKVFLFEFLNSYIMLIYQTVLLRQPEKLTIAVGSIIITRGLIQNVVSNVVPYLLSQLKKQHYMLKYYKFRDNVIATYSPNRINTEKHSQRDFLNNPPNTEFLVPNEFHHSERINRVYTQQVRPITPSIPTDLLANQTYVAKKLTLAQQLALLESVESTTIREQQKSLIDEYTDLAIQFGYITMFATSFPAAPLVFLIFTAINIAFSLNNYIHVCKREKGQAADSIGIWLNIFTIMSYSATFMNCVVIGTTNEAQLDNLIGKTTNTLRNVVLLVATEHCILLVKYIISIAIEDVPEWVAHEIKRSDYIESLSKL